MPSKVILPKKLVCDPVRMARALTNALNATAKAVQTDFRVTTATWQHKPDFRITSPTQWSREVATDDPVYAMLNKGTKAHEIAPKAGGVLAFSTPFRPKSRARYIGSNVGSTGNVSVIRRTTVHHPGTAPREWSKAIKSKWQRQFAVTMQRSIDAEH